MRKGSIGIGVILIAIGLYGIWFGGWNFGKKLTTYEHKWTLESREVTSLSVLSDYRVEMKFKKSDDGRNTIYVEGKAPERTIRELKAANPEQGELVIDLRQKGSSFWKPWNFITNFGSTKQSVVVSLADEETLESLRANSDSGSFELKDAAVNTIDITLDSGSLELDNVMADRLKANLDSGSFKGEHITANIEAEVDSGSVRLKHVSGKVKVSADSGSVKIYKDDNSVTDIDADSGSVYVEVPSSFAGLYDLRADSGSIKAPESKRQTTDVVKVRADSGSIRIEQRSE